MKNEHIHPQENGCDKGENLKADLSTGNDGRGDEAYFIEEKHFLEDGWHVDDEARTGHKNAIFIRVIRDGVMQSGHGWLEDNYIVQWG